MLVLTRRTDESLVIGENIIVTILAIEGEKVKIGISAPREIPVLRKELWQAIQEQNKIAEKLAGQKDGDEFAALRDFLASESDVELPEGKAGEK
jgi:carbon storage regulator